MYPYAYAYATRPAPPYTSRDRSDRREITWGDSVRECAHICGKPLVYAVHMYRPMKRIVEKKRLTVKSETLRTLASNQLSNIVGGDCHITNIGKLTAGGGCHAGNSYNAFCTDGEW